MVSQIPPRLTVFVYGTGAALSNVQILTQALFLFLHSFRSAPHTRLCFFSNTFSKAATRTQPELTASILPHGPLFSRPLVLQVTLWRTSALHYGRSKRFLLIKSHVLSLVHSTTKRPSPTSTCFVEEIPQNTEHTRPHDGFQSTQMLSHILRYFSRRVSIVTLSFLQGGSKR